MVLAREKAIIRAASDRTLSPDDRGHLRQFEKLLDVIRDRAEAVARGHHTATFIVGRPGVGKTFTVEQTLKDLQKPWRKWNARISPMGLWSVMREQPEGVIVIDDVSTLFSAANKGALQILLAALGGSAGEPRKICYATKEERVSFDFMGGIVAIGNVLPQRDPLVDALVSRVRVFEFEPSDEMVAAFLRNEALQGYADVTPDEAWQVVEFIIEVSRSASYRLDFRQLHLGLEDYRFCRAGSSRCDWRELILSGLQRRHRQSSFKPASRAEQIAQEEQIALDLLKRFPNGEKRRERDKQWKEMTGKGQDSFYRRRRELKEKGLL